MNLLDVPLDILVEIGSKDSLIWVVLMRNSPLFTTFTYKNIPVIVELFIVSTHEIVNGFAANLWKLFGKLHRTNDLPAIVYENGGKAWYINDLQHRDNDQPAWIDDISLSWYQYDKMHRGNDLPAHINFVYGSHEWYQNDERHRDNDLPAIIYDTGDLFWYKNDKMHRDDGKPFHINIITGEEYYLNEE